MSKKLNVDAITNELKESAFFRRPQQEQPEKDKPAPLSEKPIIQENQPGQEVPERVNARTPIRPNGKRIITRNSFETYEDQMDSLRKLSLQEKMEGKIGSMSQMVREAIDDYLKKRNTPK
jgi:hypothetical protein